MAAPRGTQRSCNIAIRDGKTDLNPLSKVRMLKEPSGRARYLSDDEETRLVAMLATDSERDRIRILIHTGLRKSEFANLRWKDVDLRAGVVTIPRSKNGETRHVPMTSVVRALLGRMPRPLDPSVLVFPSSDGTPHTTLGGDSLSRGRQSRKNPRFPLPRPQAHVRVSPRHGGCGPAHDQRFGGVEDSVDGPTIFSPITQSPKSRDRAVGYPED
jgi:integrase